MFKHHRLPFGWCTCLRRWNSDRHWYWVDRDSRIHHPGGMPAEQLTGWAHTR